MAETREKVLGREGEGRGWDIDPRKREWGITDRKKMSCKLNGEVGEKKGLALPSAGGKKGESFGIAEVRFRLSKLRSLNGSGKKGRFDRMGGTGSLSSSRGDLGQK